MSNGLPITGFRGTGRSLQVPAAACTREAALLCIQDYLEQYPDERIGTLPVGTWIPKREAALIFRHGGGTLHGWRYVEGDANLERAITTWEKLNGQIRQGGIVLWHADQIVKFGSAPRLRSRW